MNAPIIIVDCEGAIENSVKIIHKAMKKKEPVNLRFLVTSNWMHVQFLNHMATYLKHKKAKKVDHVKIEIFIEEEDRT